MRVTINQNVNIKETEIIINCTTVDTRIRNLSNYLRQYSSTLEGSIESETYYIPLDSVLYIDSVDKRTFFYDQYRIFSSQYSLTELEQKLENTLFVRISKNCLVNLAFIRSTSPYENHRIRIVMTNGENLIVSRSCRDLLNQRLRDYHAEMFHIPGMQQDIHTGAAERSVYNNGRIIGFNTTPKRIVALAYENAEILAALGLDHLLAAIAPAESILQDVSENERTSLEQIPVLTYNDQGVPSMEEILALEPDFLLGNYYSYQTLKAADRADELEELGVKFYVIEGTIPRKATIESMYTDILNLGRIFHVEDRAVELVAQMRRRIAILKRSIMSFHANKPIRVFAYDSKETQPCAAMGDSFENDVILAAGGKNVFSDGTGGYMPVSWTDIARTNPEVILIHNYPDHKTADEKIAMLCERPELSGVAAIKNHRFVNLSLLEIFPSVHLTEVVEKLIQAFYPEKL